MRLARFGAVVALVTCVATGRARHDPPAPPASPPADQAPAAPVIVTPSTQPAAVRPVVVVEPPQAEPSQPGPALGQPPPRTVEEPVSALPGALRGADEYLLWWITPAPLPALIARNRHHLPVLGSPDTRLLVGGRRVDLGEFSGGRFTTSLPFNESRSAGLEGGYFFLGTRTTTQLAANPSGPGAAFVGRTYRDAVTGREAVEPFGAGGQASEFRAASSARSQGAEINLVGEVWRGTRAQLAGLVGYRYLQVHEGLGLWQQQLDFSPLAVFPPLPPTHVATFDQFDAHNRFHGGQIGLRGDVVRGPLFLELTGKIAFGQTAEVVRAGGTTTVGRANPVVLPGGFYAQPTNAGRLTREAFAVVPEAVARVGFDWGRHARFFVGYNFLLLTEAVRPGDQIDRTLNLSQSSQFGGGALVGPERPVLAVRPSEVWLQGLTLGFEARY